MKYLLIWNGELYKHKVFLNVKCCIFARSTEPPYFAIITVRDTLFVNVAIANLIREGKTFQIPSMMQMAKADGMQLLDQAIMELLMQKIVLPDEAYVKANDKKTFERFLKQN